MVVPLKPSPVNITSIFLHKTSSYNFCNISMKFIVQPHGVSFVYRNRQVQYCRQAQPIEFLMNNFLASFDMKALFALSSLLPELHLSIRVARHTHTHIHSTTALCMPETYIIQYCNCTAIPT